MSRKMYVHQVDKYEIRCPFEDADSAQQLFTAFHETARIAINKLDKKLGKSELQLGLPEVRGIGVEFRGELFTAYGEGYSVAFLDAEMLRTLADRLGKSEPDA